MAPRDPGLGIQLPPIPTGTKVLLGLLVAAGLLGHFGFASHALALGTVLPTEPLARPWAFVTAAFLTDTRGLTHLFFSALVLYFFAPPLEGRLGAVRTVGFYVAASALGFAVAALGAHFFPRLAVGPLFGPGAGIAALTVAWARANPEAQVRLFFVVPASGRAMVWITLVFCLYGIAKPDSVPEGALAPLAGWAFGFLSPFAGSGTSPLRRWYLEAKLAGLKAQNKAVTVESVLDRTPPPPSSKPRTGGGRKPDLRIVAGGLEEELRKRRPPKDKRFLN